MGINAGFGANILSDEIMRERLSKESYRKYQNVLCGKAVLDKTLAQEVAMAAKDWAMEKGATHYSKWFQPLTGVAAEKQTSFLTVSDDGTTTYELPESTLMSGEDADASSFPNGGLREIFEARGKIKWDYTFPMFIKEDSNGKVLCIPTLLSSIKGESLDKRTPLLNSCKALSDQLLRLLRLFGDTSTQKINMMDGIEQEYFLVKKEYVDARDDLLMCERTLVGQKLIKSVEKHYMSLIEEDVSRYMKAVEQALWKLGVPVSVKHNEAAINQHELVIKYEKVELAANHDFMVREILQREAKKMGYVCFLSEKPFHGLNGSGKHNNWSLFTDTGENLFSYGNTPAKNAQFLAIITAVLSGVDQYAELIRATVATASNDVRLSAGEEAPSKIVSIHLGEELTGVIDEFTNGNSIKLGESLLALSGISMSDRNRTSPFAFIGNRFEFRMVGASDSICVCNTVLNTILAEQFHNMSDKLEHAEDFYLSLNSLLKEMLKQHHRIIFNGNSYSAEWEEEAKARRLPKAETAPEAFEAFIKPEAVQLFLKYNIYSEAEISSRYQIKMDKYIKRVNAEILVFLDMINNQIIPSYLRYANFLADGIHQKKKLERVGTQTEERLLQTVSSGIDQLSSQALELETALEKASSYLSVKEKANYYAGTLRPLMDSVRSKADSLEGVIAKEYLPFPTYFEMLHE
ncbi:MAG: glutamine synthetase III [Oscillospiraceae bacterium]|jgi:glutamine synthetase